MHRARSDLSADAGAWLNSDQFQAGDSVLKPDGSWVKVLALHRVFGAAAVYNFEVEQNHDYFVGSIGALVHNQTSCPSFLGQENGPAIPVPNGSSQTPVVNPGGQTTGFGYTGGSGGNGLSSQVSGVRIMNPTVARGPSPGYPNGYVNYMNKSGQSVNPYTGQTVGKTNFWWHIALDGSK